MTTTTRTRKKKIPELVVIPPGPKKFLAIDQSMTGNCGFSVLSGEDVVYVGKEEYKGCVTNRDRLQRFEDTLLDLLEKHQPDYIVIEQVRQFHNGTVNIKTIRMLSWFVGIALARSWVPLVAVETRVWKKLVLSNGMAEKSASVRYVMSRYGTLVTDDEADAICIALAAQQPDVVLSRLA
jgi:Holliday junction resolvasome RuvABC endonuclease subunit